MRMEPTWKTDDDRITLYAGDCLELLRAMSDKSVSVTIGSPPYEDARLYLPLKFKARGQKWVDWMIPRVVEMCRVTDGLVFINMAGKRRDWKYSPVVEWLVADLTRNHGIVCGPAPYVFHRVGIAGSGSRKYHRRDWEPIYAFALPECVPPRWTDNTACGHPPKWAPGGQMSNRHADGKRKNDSAGPKAHARWGREPAGKNQWGHSVNSGATVTERGGVVISRGTRPSHINADKLHTKTKADGSREVQGCTAPAIADPGNVLFLKVGGGQMGHDMAHDNEAPFPLGLPEFFVRSFCPPNGIALDPFCGSGTVGHAAIKHGRRFVGIDVRDSQIELTRKRLEDVIANPPRPGVVKKKRAKKMKTQGVLSFND